jgi:hypothetical protein
MVSLGAGKPRRERGDKQQVEQPIENYFLPRLIFCDATAGHRHPGLPTTPHVMATRVSGA